MTTPTIFGASGGKLLGGGEAGPEAILPLSALWEKLRQFIHEESDGDETDHGKAAAVVSSIFRKETRTLEKTEHQSMEKSERGSLSERRRANTIIQKLEVKADINRLRDLKALFNLVDELLDAQNSTDDPDPATA